MYTLDFSMIFNDIIDNLDNFNENDLVEKLSNLYKQLCFSDEIKYTNNLKQIILNTIKEIITCYEYKNIVTNKPYNNYIRGLNPTNLINSSYKSPYNFLKLDLDDFEISKFYILGSLERFNQEINISTINFLPIKTKIKSDTFKIISRERKIDFKRNSLTTNELNYNVTYTYYINSIIDEIHKYNYSLKNIQIDDYKDLGLNDLLNIVYYQIEQRHITPNKKLIVKRCHKYPEYIEITLDNQKFLTTYNIENGINSLLDYNKPFDKTITRIDGNPYTSFMISNHKIESKEEKLIDDIDEKDKENFVKYYKYVNKTL